MNDEERADCIRSRKQERESVLKSSNYRSGINDDLQLINLSNLTKNRREKSKIIFDITS